MRKLSSEEEFALDVLQKHGSWCPGERVTINLTKALDVLDALVKKKLAWIEPTDDGPRFHAL